MKKQLLKLGIGVLIVVFSFFPLFVLAQQGTGSTGGGGDAPNLPPSPITGYNSVVAILTRITNWLFGILILLAVIFFVLAAYKYLTSAGDPAKVKEATNTLVYGTIAVVVALVARGIPFIVASFIGTDTNVIEQIIPSNPGGGPDFI